MPWFGVRMRRAAERFRDWGLEWKVFLMTSIVILIAVPLTGAFSFNQAARYIEEYAYNAADRTVSQLSANVGNELKNVSDKLYWINSSDELTRAIEWSQNRSDEAYSVIFNNVFSLFSKASLSSPTIRGIYLYTPKGEFFEGVPAARKETDFKETVYYEAIKPSSTNRWVYSGQNPLFVEEGAVIGLVSRPATATGALELDNYLVITLRADYFERNLQSIQLVPDGFAMILDENGRPILLSSRNEATEQFLEQAQVPDFSGKPSFFEVKLGDQTYLVNHRPIPIAGWQALVIQPKKQLLVKIAYIQYFTVLLTVALLAFSFFMNKSIASWVTLPVRRLQRLMSQAKKGDLDVRFASESRDEIGELGRRFDELLDQIQRLLKQVVEESLAKRRAEMRALQAQINPHFLYNTLDEIYWKSLEFNDSSASEIILSLSRFFRLSLNRGEEATTVGKEMEHVEQYLKLVNYQYKRQFAFEVAVDERTKEIVVPKIILQPLAENAVLHAFQDNEYQNNRIRVKSFREGTDTTVLTVEDNGSGIDPELIALFNAPLHAAEAAPGVASRSGEGYAIMNIKERLRYFFGERASFRAESRVGEGSRFEIRICDAMEEVPHESTVGGR
ncbi:cache domain-containing sensor histidine kinase [Paenibacillus ehimensis]|uniref:cache domain-containing sensor histidine kinase n=1 Tax=Paenibacillus ehimensis TaxID=79264 RepID=UPI00046EB081|nr:sensor histidine kinase [Paenibacillus ehimensis]MEC0212756.1 sensor histidine kinase [Paenibacillus ehimensis]